MYLATYTVEGASWRQAAAGVTYPGGDDAGRVEEWGARFRMLLRGLDAVPDLSASLRVRVDQHRLAAALFAVAPAEREEQLRRALARLTQLDVIGDGEVRFARERAEHDTLLQFPRLQTCVALPHLATPEAWFAVPFRVQDRLSELLADAYSQGHDLTYHLNIEQLPKEPELLRQAARNALRVADVQGVPPLLEQLQHDLVAKLRRATHVCEELLGVDSQAASEWLRDALDRQFRETYGRYIVPEFTFVEDAHHGSITATRHRFFFEPCAVDEICSAALTADERLNLLSWQPGRELSSLMSRVSAPVEDVEQPAVIDHTGMPTPYCGTEPYAFISYKRQDLERIKPLVAQLTARGYRIWYDKGIPGGAEWDALIEERVQHCEVLLLFLSQAAVGSKYVRREVKFADTLGKPVVGIRLERDIDLLHGMAMLLNQYQVIDSSATSLADELDQAVRFVRLL